MSAQLRLAIGSAVAFQAVWIGSALSAAAARPFIGVTLASAVIALQVLLSKRRQHLLLVIAASAALGLVIESALIGAGLVVPANPSPVPSLAPLWMIGLWAVFGTLLDTAFRPLANRPVLAALVGALFGPAAYVTGDRLGALHINEPVWPGLAAIAIIWGVMLPLLLAIEQRLPD